MTTTATAVAGAARPTRFVNSYGNNHGNDHGPATAQDHATRPKKAARERAG